MSEHKHTPGPWEVDGEDILANSGDTTVAMTFWTNQRCPDDECRANARLIAAAPELLAACEELLKLVDDLEGMAAMPLTPECTSKEVAKAKAAIAKAKGGA